MPKSQSCLQIQLPKGPYRPEQRSTQDRSKQILKIGHQCVCSICRRENPCYEQFTILENSKILAYIFLKCSLISIKTVPIEKSLPKSFISFSIPTADAVWINHRYRSGQGLPSFHGSSYSSRWFEMGLILLRYETNSSCNFLICVLSGGEYMGRLPSASQLIFTK